MGRQGIPLLLPNMQPLACGGRAEFEDVHLSFVRSGLVYWGIRRRVLIKLAVREVGAGFRWCWIMQGWALEPNCCRFMSCFGLCCDILIRVVIVLLPVLQDKNCILADEMGLGKTVQCVSFLSVLAETIGNRGPFLVVVPLSTVPNWLKEFKKWVPQVSKGVCTYSGGV